MASSPALPHAPHALRPVLLRHRLERGGGAPVGRAGGGPPATFVVSGLLSGLAGILYVAYLPTATPSLGSAYELHAVAATVLGGCSLQGGRGSVFGVVIGAGIMQVTFNAVNLVGHSLWQNVVAGGVILAAVIVDQLIRTARAQRSARAGAGGGGRAAPRPRPP